MIGREFGDNITLVRVEEETGLRIPVRVEVGKVFPKPIVG